MPQYLIRAKVDQVVTKMVRLLVNADGPEQAEDRAGEALKEYPEAVTVEGISRMCTDNAHYWIPRNIDIVEIREERSA